MLTGSSVFSHTRIDLSCEPVTTNFPVLLTTRAQISPWCPSSFWMFSNCSRHTHQHIVFENLASTPAHLIPIPVFEHLVLSCAPQIVAVAFVSFRPIHFALESHLHNTLVMRKKRLVAVTEVETPYLNVLISRARYNQLRICRDIERQYGELVTC